MKVGDKVKVKSWEEISKTLNNNSCCVKPNKNGSHLYFNKDLMFKYVNLTGTISEINNNTGNVQIKFTEPTNPWWWHPSWLDLIPGELEVDKNCTPKWLIFGMIFQYLSGNCPNPSILHYMSTPGKKIGGFDFSDFGYNFIGLQQETVPFPDWPILNLPLDKAYKILEHCFTYGTFKKDLEFFTYEVSTIIFGGFPWNSTPEGDDYWSCQSKCYKGSNLKEKLEELTLQAKSETLTTQIKTENYENKLQRKKSIVIRGTVPEGSIACGRKRKTSVAVGYLSNSVCIGG